MIETIPSLWHVTEKKNSYKIDHIGVKKWYILKSTHFPDPPTVLNDRSPS